MLSHSEGSDWSTIQSKASDWLTALLHLPGQLLLSLLILALPLGPRLFCLPLPALGLLLPWSLGTGLTYITNVTTVFFIFVIIKVLSLTRPVLVVL